MQPTRSFNARPKHLVRRLLLSGVEFTHGLTMPGPEALCASKLIRDLDSAAEKPRTLTCVDRCFPTIANAATVIRGLTKQHKNAPSILYYHGELASLCVANTDLDFAFLDLCGPMNSPIARWIQQELVPHAASTLTIAGTLARSCRASIFMQRVRRFFAKDPATDTLYSYCRDLLDNATGTVGNMRPPNNTWLPLEPTAIVPIQQLGMLVLLLLPRHVAIDHFLLYPSLRGSVTSGFHMTAFRVTATMRPGRRMAWLHDMAARFHRRVVVRKHTYDKELVPQAVAAYRAGRIRKATSLWMSGTPGQRASISLRVGKRLRKILVEG